MLVKIWFPRKHQVTLTLTCHMKLFPDKVQKKSPSLVAFALILKKRKVINVQSRPVARRLLINCGKNANI